MPMHDRRKGRIPHIAKLPRTVKSVDDLLASDDVNRALDDLEKMKGNIAHLIVIAIDRDYVFHYRITNQTVAELVYYLECAKQDAMSDDILGEAQ